MGQIGVGYGTNTALPITLSGGITDGSARESDLINNNSTQSLDAHVQIKLDLPTSSATGSDRAAYVYAYGNAATSELTYPVTGTDAAITLTNISHQLREIGRIVNGTSSGAISYTSPAFSVASAFNGVLPRRWGIVVHNKFGITITTSTSNNTATYYTVSLATL